MAETIKKTSEEKMVKIKLPRNKKGESIPVWINEKSWSVPTGVAVEVPECVAEVLQFREVMEEKTDQILDGLENYE